MSARETGEAGGTKTSGRVTHREGLWGDTKARTVKGRIRAGVRRASEPVAEHCGERIPPPMSVMKTPIPRQ